MSSDQFQRETQDQVVAAGLSGHSPDENHELGAGQPVQIPPDTQVDADGPVHSASEAHDFDDKPVQRKPVTHGLSDGPVHLGVETHGHYDGPVQCSNDTQHTGDGPVHFLVDTHCVHDRPVHPNIATQDQDDGPVHLISETHVPGDRSVIQLCQEIKEAHRFRTDLLVAEGNLHRQILGACRRECWHSSLDKMSKEEAADTLLLFKAIHKDPSLHPKAAKLMSVYPLIQARAIVHKKKLEYDKVLESKAKKLLVWPWAEQIVGFGATGLGQIIAEAGRPLSDYPNPAKLWTRLCLGLVEVNGEWKAQRRIKGAEALKHQFSPKRRAIMFAISVSMMNNRSCRYRELYDSKKEYYQQNRTVEPIEKKGKPGPGWCKDHIHKAALKFMVKALVKDLWVEWRRVYGH